MLIELAAVCRDHQRLRFDYGGNAGTSTNRSAEPHRGTGDRCGHREFADLGDRADRRPDERALPLFVIPRVVVVADPQAIESGVFGHPGLFDQFGGSVFLAGQEVSDLDPADLRSVAPIPVPGLDACIRADCGSFGRSKTVCAQLPRVPTR